MHVSLSLFLPSLLSFFPSFLPSFLLSFFTLFLFLSFFLSVSSYRFGGGRLLGLRFRLVLGRLRVGGLLGLLFGEEAVVVRLVAKQALCQRARSVRLVRQAMRGLTDPFFFVGFSSLGCLSSGCLTAGWSASFDGVAFFSRLSSSARRRWRSSRWRFKNKKKKEQEKGKKMKRKWVWQR